MPLVAYSDSDDSDTDAKVAVQHDPKLASAPLKSAFQKVVDRSNPHKISVRLPENSKSPDETTRDGQEPPLKRAKLGTGMLNSFNSILPVPKRHVASNTTSSSRSMGKGDLGRGISLQTGSAPGFSRDTSATAEGRVDVNASMEPPTEDADPEPRLPIDNNEYGQSISSYKEEETQVQKKATPAMFKPLSVARKPKKKKTELPEGMATAKAVDSAQSRATSSGQKATLFSVDTEYGAGNREQTVDGEYRPMVYELAQESGEVTKESMPETSCSENRYFAAEDQSTKRNDFTNGPIVSEDTSQSLETIASDLNLSASAKRQLFGRNKNRASGISVVNFNTDQEYAANELLRQAGEQAQHNPVRSIAPGKHSLKQLVNAASHQKDALEEHFASGKRNKREAGSKYGW